MRALLVPLVFAWLAFPMAGFAAEAAEEERIQTGLASWFGPGLEGETTASGEPLDSDDLAAAHPSHPAGTRLRVTNLENGRSVEVRVVDRGPSAANRREGVVVDVSRAAAERLGFVDEGQAQVRVEVLESSSRSGG